MRSIFFSLILLLLSLRLSAIEVHYVLSMPEPHTHYYEVAMTVKGVDQPTLDVKMPTWIPGSYLIREFSRNVEAVRATNSKGKALTVTQRSKNTWQVATNGAAEVTVNYRVYAFELSVRTSFLDASHAVVNGTSVFFYVDGQVNHPVTLEVRPDPSWKTVSTGLRNKDGATWEFEAANYDELVDCPLEIGNHEVLTFSASGVQHEVAMVGRAEYDAEKITVDMAKVVDACTGVFGENPNANYTFIVLNGANRGGGLEHRNSTTLQMNRWAYRDSYKGFLGLVAHEYFHLWNVKRMRPKALGPFDYENENYSRLLWVMEGFTSYYDEYLLHRAGFYTDEEYLQKVTSGINAIENQPGNKVQPVAQSSFNAWIKAYRPDENSRNVTISYYTKGGVVATLLNLEIMQATKGEKDLDDLMRYLYDTYYKRMDRGFTDAEMLQAVETVAGKKMGPFFDRFVYGTESPDYARILGYAGLEVEAVTPRDNQAQLGVRTSSSGGKVTISRVDRGTAAYENGLNVNDEIIAINDFRVTSTSALTKLIDRFQPGDELEIVFARDGLMQTTSFKVKGNPYVRYTVRKKESMSKAEQVIWDKWLGK